MQDQEISDFIKGKVTSTSYVESGLITTTAKVIFLNGTHITGTDSVELSGYNKETAQKAAYDNAVASLMPGVALILNKQL